MPVHGEYVHLLSHRDLALSLGIPKENIFVMSIGEVLEVSKKDARINGTVTAGQVLVDGLGVGDVGNIVLRDRRNLSENGLMIVVVAIDSASGSIISGPDIISRGFVYVRESEDLMEEAKKVINDALLRCELNHISGWSGIKNTIKDTLKNFLWQKMKRSPMILPIIMEV
ncbi:Ribonuclease J1 [bioreactor metagenome]|uniref:Ribonuclease J1 n=1 Tax=bioreactor metagenome TaxID=1076179 RepID=A0A645BZB8_9ZZZZ